MPIRPVQIASKYFPTHSYIIPEPAVIVKQFTARVKIIAFKLGTAMTSQSFRVIALMSLFNLIQCVGMLRGGKQNPSKCGVRGQVDV
jgi:hypothetical protein